MLVQEAVSLTKEDQRILDSLMPGGNRWHTPSDLECLPTCPYSSRCVHHGPAEKVCSVDWRRAPLDEDSSKVFVHVVEYFDFYNQGDLLHLNVQSNQVAALHSKFVKAMERLVAPEYSEGSLQMKQHRRRERAKGVSQRMKSERFFHTKKLECEACGVDFYALYGTEGFQVIECHHQIPLAHADHKGKTNVQDLALLCANCHRLAHTSESLHRTDALRRYVQVKAGK
ncbi:HNH endonuclease [Pseudomonas sp. NPDC086278]|uniref:HNH endonuclease n=1 Tax=Pseudomonas sp. NPDC086278 TaxID=3390646 RepID=UPI003CFDE93A